MDGNVIRVFSRLAALKGHAKSSTLGKQCWKLAEELVDPQRPGAFNQALMELGATICTPLAPACSRCPVSGFCKARRLAAAHSSLAVTDFPAKQSPKPRRRRSLALAALMDASGAWLLVRRAPTGLLAGQLEFPAVELGDLEEGKHISTVSVQVTAELQKMLSNLGVSEVQLTSVGDPVEHVFSHEHHVMYIFRGCLPGAQSSDLERDVLWLTPDAAQEAGITSGLQKARLLRCVQTCFHPQLLLLESKPT